MTTSWEHIGNKQTQKKNPLPKEKIGPPNKPAHFVA
jgi:hypothetical protein